MTTTPRDSNGEGTIVIRRVRGARYDEISLLWQAHGRRVSQSDVDVLVDQLSRDHDAHCLRVVVFGDTDLDPADDRRPRCLVARHQYPDGRPRSGVEISAIGRRPGEPVEIVPVDAGTTLVRTEEDGREIRRMIHVSAVGTGATALDQATTGLRQVEQALTASGLAPRHIDRTWYFLADIANNYEELNKARNAMFDRWGLTTFPASTGIGAALPGDGLVSLMVEATAADGVPVAVPFDTDLQCAPYEYGPRFVRANRLRRNGCDVVNISGISSINERGESLPGDDARAAVDHAMASFTDLLGKAEMSYQDLAGCYVYCKDAEVREAFQRWQAESGFSAPYLLNMVDVCRPELRFEIEGRALRRSAPGR